MKRSNILSRLHWLNLPGALLVALLQRAPVVRLAGVAEAWLVNSPIATLLRSAIAATGLGALHSLAGATQFVQNPGNPVTGTVGQPLSVGFTITGSPAPPVEFTVNTPLPPGMRTIPEMDGNKIRSGTPTITGTPTQAGAFSVSVTGSDGIYSEDDTIVFQIAAGAGGGGTPPAVTTQPAVAQFPTEGGSATFSVSAAGSPAPSIQWQRNGVDLSGATSATLTIDNVQPPVAGVYRAVLNNTSGTASSSFSILGVGTASKVIGTGAEVGANIQHPNGNFFDQVLLQGAAVTATADVGQVLRISFIDLNNDIVQVEFSGAGSLSLLLDNVSGPAAPESYNQPSVAYMKGHAGIVVTGANQNTNLSVFSIGRANAFDPTGAYNILAPISATNNPANNGSSLFQPHPGADNEGHADIAFIAIASTDGKFGGLRTANTSYFATRGLTGVYAPGVEFLGPVFIGNISASDNATPMIMLGAAGNTQINGGDLAQSNGRAVQVSGLSQLRFVTGSNSHGAIFPAQNNKGKLEQNGADVTSQVVVNPSQ
jgi:hypothetical protein